ncbi:MAG: glucose-6-phosphate isomerase [Armatimonadota bacterium]
MEGFSFDYSNVMNFINPDEVRDIGGSVLGAEKSLKNKTCPGADFLCWLDYPETIEESLINDIKDTAYTVRENYDLMVCIGIGGSYLGARAAIEALKYNTEKEFPVIFLGQNLNSDYIYEVLKLVEDKEIAVNVISKSGTTLESALSFRLVREFMEKRYGKHSARKRIIATTDKEKGALRKLADDENYKTFIINDDIGGRFSVLTPVGLLPIAVCGADIEKLLLGAKKMMEISSNEQLDKNPVYTYAALRHLLYKSGKTLEILSSFTPHLHYLTQWWVQLFGESEGKDKKGIFPAACTFTTDLHSIGQYIQDGLRNIFETFLWVEKSKNQVTVPQDKENLDKLNYVAGKSFDYINEQAFKGTSLAHKEGGVPNMTLSIPCVDEYNLGQVFYFFEKAIAVSGLLLGINPFDQPGVEAYKKNMFALMGKPGTEDQLQAIKKNLANIKEYKI